MPMNRRSKVYCAGFSLVELVITMMIMIILVGVVSMRATNLTTGARAGKIVATVEALRAPVVVYREDLGQWPIELSTSTSAKVHQLAFDPGFDGWDGPYIGGPIRRSLNPTGGSINVFSEIPDSYSNSNGIDLDGDGTPDLSGPEGCLILFTGVDKEIAMEVDATLDKDVQGPWTDAGRVEYEEAKGQLSVLLASD